jgi:hypothetical protein
VRGVSLPAHGPRPGRRRRDPRRRRARASVFRELTRQLGLADHPAFTGNHLDRDKWPAIRTSLAKVFAIESRDTWATDLLKLWRLAPAAITS